jgi:hypothetical protein
MRVEEAVRILLVSGGANWAISDVHRGYSDALRAAGHEIVDYNLEGRITRAGGYLHYLWQKSKQPPENHPSPADTIYLAGQGILERALRHQVDWTIVIAGMYVHPDWLTLLQRAHIRTALILTESPYDDDRQARLLPSVDCAFTNERTSVDVLRQANPNVWYLASAIDPKRHTPDAMGSDIGVPSHDVVFVGSGFPERVELLSAVDWSGIDFGLYGSWDHLASRHRLRKYLRAGITPNDRTAALYRRAKIGLNLHRVSVDLMPGSRRIEYAESINPRGLELAACGVFHLSDSRAEVTERLGSVVPTFSGPAELERLIRRYLPDEDARWKLAYRLPALVASETFDARVETLVGILESDRVTTLRRVS